MIPKVVKMDVYPVAGHDSMELVRCACAVLYAECRCAGGQHG